jgi:hypothetical protein
MVHKSIFILFAATSQEQVFFLTFFRFIMDSCRFVLNFWWALRVYRTLSGGRSYSFFLKQVTSLLFKSRKMSASSLVLARPGRNV